MVSSKLNRCSQEVRLEKLLIVMLVLLSLIQRGLQIVLYLVRIVYGASLLSCYIDEDFKCRTS
jgi:hypothetical protein